MHLLAAFRQFLPPTLRFMRRHIYLGSFLLAVRLSAPLTLQAQTSEETADLTTAETAPDAGFLSVTSFKLGTGLTRGQNIGGHLGFSLLIVSGLPSQLAPVPRLLRRDAAVGHPAPTRYARPTRCARGGGCTTAYSASCHRLAAASSTKDELKAIIRRDIL